MTTVSSIYFTACIAAEKALPPESKAVLERYDEHNRAWLQASCPHPQPAELVAAGEALHRDPLASAAIAIRRLGNAAWGKEQNHKATTTATPSA